ncbi:hypothetical protein [Thalassospira sp.]|uniref:hypothetical protein n=1 Tax=Thalassospira sp. TaxID=1912094 RepID=UPI00273532B1|nr:hypothetical protein [Thalassospira sp.]MDP2699149.1 hypothetical protein [Thalassospira sp.]
MSTVALKNVPIAHHKPQIGWFENFINALRVAMIMQNTKAVTHAELMDDWRKAWQEVEG